MAVGQLVEVQRHVELLAADHPLAPRGTRAEQYQSAAGKVTLAPIIGRIVALPELTDSGHLTGLIICPEPKEHPDINGATTNPALVLPAIPGVERHGAFWYQATRTLSPA